MNRSTLAPLALVLALCPALPAGGLREVFGERDGVQVKSGLPEEVSLLRGLLASPGGGTDPAVICSEEPCTIQTLYADPQEGNGVLLIWKMTGSAHDPVTLLLDGAPVCNVPPLPPEDLPGYNLCLVSHLPLSCAPQSDPACQAEAACGLPSRAVDARIFEIRRGDGATQAICQEVIGGRPMAVSADFCCRPGGGVDTCAFIPAKYNPNFCDLEAEGDDSDIIVSGGNTGPPPSFIEIQADDDGVVVSRRVQKNIDNVFCFRRTLSISTRGSHAVDISGLVTRSDARFLSWFNPQTGDSYDGLVGSYLMSYHHQVTVSGGRPKAPRGLFLRQAAYAEGAGNTVIAAWEPAEAPYLAVHVYLDDLSGASHSDLAGGEKLVTLGSLAPGLHRVGVAGDGGPTGGGSSAITQAAIELRSRSPFPDPVAGSIACAFSPAGGGTLTATWSPSQPSAFIDVFLAAVPEPVLKQTIPGDATGVSLPGAKAGDRIVLVFYQAEEGVYYGSPPQSCGAGSAKRYVRGLCGGGVGLMPDISSAAFGLNFLFLGGKAPPCRAACDVNGDGAFDISDMVSLLSYLFTGGLPPAGWPDANADGQAEPACREALAEEDCETAHEACP